MYNFWDLSLKQVGVLYFMLFFFAPPFRVGTQTGCRQASHSQMDKDHTLGQWLSKYGSNTNSISIPRKIVRNANSQDPPQI